MLNLQRANEKYHCGVIEKQRTVSVVIAFELYYVFVACVLLVHLFGMVRLNELVLFTSSEQRRNKALCYVINRL